MPRKHEKEYRKFVIKISKWLKETKDRIEMLPDMERLGSLTYDQWCKIFKEQHQFKEIPAPPPPPPPRLLREGSEPPKAPPEKHSCRVCKNYHTAIPPHDNWCDKGHSGYKINKTNNCEDYE